MKKNVIVIAVMLVLVGFAVYQNVGKAEKEVQLPVEYAPKLDFLAPEFKLQSFDGQEYRVGGKRDKPLWINFWASWCEPCQAEAPDMKRLYDEYKDKLDIYAVNATLYDDVDKARDFIKQYGFKFPALLDVTGGEKGKVQKLYNVQAYPTSFLIDKDGVIREIIYGIKPPKELERTIKNFVEA